MPAASSRERFEKYRQSLKDRKSGSVPVAGHGSGDPARRKLGSRQRSTGELLRAFWQQLGGFRHTILVALALLTVATILGLIPPAGTKAAIDYVLTSPPEPLPQWLEDLPIPSAPMPRLVLIAVVITAIVLVQTVINLAGRWIATRTVNRVQVAVRRRLFEHTIRLPLHDVYRLKSGGVASLLREDAGGVAELIFSMLYNPWRAVIQFIGSLLVLILVDWRLMLGGLMLVPAVYLTHRTWVNRIRPLFRDVRHQRQRIDSNATETFGGIRVVRTFARARNEATRFTTDGDLLVRHQLYTWWWTRIIEVVWEVIIPLASTGLLLYGGYQILSGDMTLGDLMMFLVYLTMLLGPLATLAASAVQFQNNLAGLDRILDILEHPTEGNSRPDAVALEKSQVAGRVELRNVNFTYPESESQVLYDINLSVAPGETVALVGPSGAGKTTLCNLVARFYHPQSGSVLIDGRDVRDTTLESYRRLLGVVEQDVFLFDGTIYENIAYGRRDASREEVIEAARAAAADDFIRQLPDGYETVIGERGIKLSGGQRQRLAIARALVADPRILILDEATSNLDSENERLIQASLEVLLHGRTAFVIAHRLSTIIDADRIIVLDGGRIVQQGTHAELAGRGGQYREMVRLQLRQGVAVADDA